MTHLSALAPPALEEAGEHDAVPLVCTVVLQANLKSVWGTLIGGNNLCDLMP